MKLNYLEKLRKIHYLLILAYGSAITFPIVYILLLVVKSGPISKAFISLDYISQNNRSTLLQHISHYFKLILFFRD